MDINLMWEKYKNQIIMEHIFKTSSKKLMDFLNDAYIKEVNEDKRSRSYIFEYKKDFFRFTFQTVINGEIRKSVLSSISKNTFDKLSDNSWVLGDYLRLLDQEMQF